MLQVVNHEYSFSIPEDRYKNFVFTGLLDEFAGVNGSMVFPLSGLSFRLEIEVLIVGLVPCNELSVEVIWTTLSLGP